jgi:hypothetical protein
LIFCVIVILVSVLSVGLCVCVFKIFRREGIKNNFLGGRGGSSFANFGLRLGL